MEGPIAMGLSHLVKGLPATSVLCCSEQFYLDCLQCTVEQSRVKCAFVPLTSDNSYNKVQCTVVQSRVQGAFVPLTCDNSDNKVNPCSVK